jgi:hypothetical protein
MNDIWAQLPNDLVYKILNMADLSIDTRLYFKLENRKIKINKNIFFPRPKIIFQKDSKNMFDFTGMTDIYQPFWIVRKNIKFSQFRTPDIYVFNMGWDPYSMTMYSNDEEIGPTQCQNHIVFRGYIKFV